MKALFQTKPDRKLVLASASPRRRELLESLVNSFSIISVDILEPEPEIDEEPGHYAARAAELKGRAAQPSCGAEAIILAADTIVAAAGKILRKPRDAKDALTMLQLLNGKTHVVYTGYYLAYKKKAEWEETVSSQRSEVTFGLYSSRILQAYVESGEPLDRAGAYTIAGTGAFLVKSVTGSWSNVLGLPVETVCALLLSHNLVDIA